MMVKRKKRRRNSTLVEEELHVAGHSVILRLLCLDFEPFCCRPCGLVAGWILVLEVRGMEFVLSVSMELSGYFISA